MSDENTETVEQILSEMEGHCQDGPSARLTTCERGYAVAAGAFARRLRTALERQQ